MDTSLQKCWYCKRNAAENEYLNIIDKTKTDVEIKGFYKVKNTTHRTLKVVRCKECYDIHENVTKVSGYLFYISFVFCFLYLIIENTLPFLLDFLFSLLTGLIVFSVFRLVLGYIYAAKYKIKTEWSKGGFF